MNIVSATITGSLILNGVNISSITGSESSINALNLFTASAATTGSNQFNGNQTVTGSVDITGSLIVTGSIIGTVTTASYVLNAVSASYAANATTSSYALVATSASYAANSDLLDGRDSLTFANTGSNAFVGTQNINGAVAITGSLTTTGAITAQTLNVQQVTSSIVYSSGSNIFGNSVSNTQSMTGSVGISGSLSVNGISTLSGALSGTSATFSSSVTATDLIITDTYANDPLIKLVTTTSGNVEVQMRTSTTTYNAGIGVVTSGYDFNIFTNNTARLTIASTGAATFSSTATATAFIPSGATVPTNGMYLSAANTLDFATNTTNRLSITSAGNVGIGITSPLANLTIKGADGTPGATDKGIFQIVDASLVSLAIGGYTASPYGMFMQVIDAGSGNSGTYPLILNPNGGNVGIGTTSPNITVYAGTVLTVGAGTSGETAIEVYGGKTGADGAAADVAFLNSYATGADKRIALIRASRSGDNNSGSLTMYSRNAGTLVAALTIASTGAATFSSTIQTTAIGIGGANGGTQLIYGTMSTTNTILELNNTNASGYGGYIRAALGSTQYILRLVDQAGNNRFSFYGDGTSSFSGAATFSGQIKTTFAGQSISINAASTDSVRIQLQNTTGNAGVVVENSVGGDQFTGTTAYSMAIGTFGTKDLFLATNSVQRFKLDGTSGAATFSSSVQSGNISIPTPTSSESSLFVQTANSDMVFAAYSSTYTPVANYASKAVIQAGNAGSGTGQLLLASWETGGIMTFYTGGRTSGYERMRITSAGNVGIGTTSPSEKLTIEGAVIRLQGGVGVTPFAIANNDSDGFRIYDYTAAATRFRIATTGASTFSNFNGAAVYGVTINTNNNTGTQYMMDFQRIGSQAGYIASTSSTTAGIFNTSDYRIKEDLQSFNGIDKLMSMKFYDFKWKSNEGFRDYGVIAHELQEVLPMAVIGEKNGEKNQAVDYAKLIPIMAKAIQELKAEIDLLKGIAPI